LESQQADFQERDYAAHLRLGCRSLVEILLLFAARELLRMFADVADIAIEREINPPPSAASRQS